MRNHKGFSLVELIVVIAIMAILVGVIAPQLIKYIEKSNVSSDMQMLDAVYKAVIYASIDPEVLTDPNSSVILSNMETQAITLESLQSSSNRLCEEVISTLGWNDLNQSTYESLIRSAHEPDATIYFTNRGNFVNPVIMWITTTDASGGKDTSNNPTNYSDSVLEEIRSCIHIDHIE